MIAKASQGRHYISWRGQVVLVAKEQMRHVTSVEAAAVETVQEDISVTAARNDKQHRDVADAAAIPQIKPVKKKIVKFRREQRVPRRIREEIEDRMLN